MSCKTPHASRSPRYIAHCVSQILVPRPFTGCQAISASVSRPWASARRSSRASTVRAAGDSSTSPRNMSVYWDPCPGKIAATSGLPAGLAAARAGCGARIVSASDVASCAVRGRAASGTGIPLSSTRCPACRSWITVTQPAR